MPVSHIQGHNVLTCVLDLPTERLLELWTTVNTKIWTLIQSHEGVERMGGIQALEALADFDGVDAAMKTTRFTQYLRHVLKSKDQQSIPKQSSLHSRPIPRSAIRLVCIAFLMRQLQLAWIVGPYFSEHGGGIA